MWQDACAMRTVHDAMKSAKFKNFFFQMLNLRVLSRLLSRLLKEVAIMARSPKNDAKVAKPPNNPNQIAFALINCSLVQLTSSSRDPP